MWYRISNLVIHPSTSYIYHYSLIGEFLLVVFFVCYLLILQGIKWHQKICFFRKDYLAIPTSLPTHQPITLGQQSLSVPDNPMRHEIARLHSFLKREWNQTVSEHLSLAGLYLIAESPGKKTRKSNFNCPFSSLKGKKPCGELLAKKLFAEKRHESAMPSCQQKTVISCMFTFSSKFFLQSFSAIWNEMGFTWSNISRLLKTERGMSSSDELSCIHYCKHHLALLLKAP